MQTCCPVFNTNRMVSEYTEKFYLPAARRWFRFREEGYKVTKDVAAWRAKLESKWDEVRSNPSRHRSPTRRSWATSCR